MAEEVKETVVEEAKATSEAPKDGAKKQFNKKNDKKFQRPQRKPIVKEFEERVVAINRVTKVVKGGKRMKFSALVVIGDGKGKFGYATGKSGEVPDAIKKAVDKAKRNMLTLNMVKGGTIAHEVLGKFGASKVFLKPAPEGTGIIAGGPVRAIIELAGLKNVYSKVYGSRTKVNVDKATAQALAQLKEYKSVIALRQGGKEDVK